MAKNSKIQHLRTSTSGLLPNTTNSSNTSFIDAGEFAVNLTDKKVLSSNGSATFEIGGNLSSLQVTGAANISGAATTGTLVTGAMTVRGSALGSGEGGQIVLGYGNNLAASITTQANNTFNIDVTGGNTGSTPLLRLFTVNNDGTTSSIASFANTGKINFGSTVENTETTVKIIGTANVTQLLNASGNLNAPTINATTSVYVGANVVANVTTIAVGNSTVYSNIGAGSISATGNTTILGKVGIGAAPGTSTNLRVYNQENSGTATDSVTVSVKSDNRFAVVDVDSSASHGGAYIFKTAGTEAGRLYYDADENYLSFSVNGSVFTTAERMRISSSGNVGIGNTTPNAKLQVTGTANISGVVSLGANVSIIGGIIANGSIGTAGQVLTSNASAIYWSTVTGGGGGSSVTISSSAPGTPSSGDLWWSSDQGNMKIYYDDGNSSQWVDASRGTPGPTGPMYGSRLVASSDAASITPNANTTDVVTQLNTQAVGTLTINAPTGSVADGQKLMFRIKSTNIQTLSWNAVYAGGADLTLPSATSGSSLTDYYGFIYNSGATKWHLLSKISGF